MYMFCSRHFNTDGLLILMGAFWHWLVHVYVCMRSVHECIHYSLYRKDCSRQHHLMQLIHSLVDFAIRSENIWGYNAGQFMHYTSDSQRYLCLYIVTEENQPLRHTNHVQYEMVCRYLRWRYGRDDLYFCLDTNAGAWSWIHKDEFEEVAYVAHVNISNDWDRYLRTEHMRKPNDEEKNWRLFLPHWQKNSTV